MSDTEKNKKMLTDKEWQEKSDKIEEQRQAFIQSYQNAEPSEAIAIPVANFVDEKVAEALGENFSLDTDTGKIKLKKGTDAIKAFGAGFRSLNELFSKSTELGEGFAIYEARLALAAKEQFGNVWTHALAGASPKDLIRIKKNMRAIEISQELGFKLTNIPIGTVRALTEVNYDKTDEEKNKATKKKVIKEFLKKSEEKGSPLNQIEARQLIAKVVPSRSEQFRHTWNFIYFFYDKGVATVVGSFELDDELFDKATIIINNKSQRVTLTDEGEYKYDQIPTYVGEPAEKNVAEQAKAPKGPGAKKKTKEEVIAAFAAASATAAAATVPEPEQKPEPAPPAEEEKPAAVYTYNAEEEEEEDKSPLDDIFLED
jgi:hypothetical protein